MKLDPRSTSNVAELPPLESDLAPRTVERDLEPATERFSPAETILAAHGILADELEVAVAS